MVTVGPDQNAMWQRRFPLVMIRPGPSTVDPAADEEPSYIQQTISVRLVQGEPGDDVGEMCMLGAHQPELQGVSSYTESKATSSGKGLLQIEEVVLSTLASLSPDDGVDMLCRSKGGVDAVLDNEMGYVCWRDYQFEAQLTADRTFPAPSQFRALDSGGFGWNNPDRFDLSEIVIMTGTLPGLLTWEDGDGSETWNKTTSGYDLTDETASVAAGGIVAFYDDYHPTPTDRKDMSPVRIKG